MLDHYATVSGRNVDEIDYYVILARFKLAIVLEAGYARVVAGDADNPAMAAYEYVVLDTMAAAAELAQTTVAREVAAWGTDPPVTGPQPPLHGPWRLAR